MQARYVGIASVVLAVAFALLTVFVAQHPTADIVPGEGIVAVVDKLPWLIDACEVLAILGGDTVLLIAVVAVAGTLLATRHPRLATYLVLSALGSVVLVALMKSLVERDRPATNGVLVLAGGWSYPSGHASAGIAVVGAIGVVCLAVGRRPPMRVLGWCLIGLGVTIGLSRVLLGVHYALDVLGGWLLGAAVTCTAGFVVLYGRSAKAPADESIQLSVRLDE